MSVYSPLGIITSASEQEIVMNGKRLVGFAGLAGLGLLAGLYRRRIRDAAAALRLSLRLRRSTSSAEESATTGTDAEYYRLPEESVAVTRNTDFGEIQVFVANGHLAGLALVVRLPEKSLSHLHHIIDAYSVASSHRFQMVRPDAVQQSGLDNRSWIIISDDPITNDAPRQNVTADLLVEVLNGVAAKEATE